MAGQDNEPTDGGRWLRDQRDASVRDAFLDDFYGGGEQDEVFGAERTNRFRAYVIVVAALLVAAGIGFALSSGGDDQPEQTTQADLVEVATLGTAPLTDEQMQENLEALEAQNAIEVEPEPESVTNPEPPVVEERTTGDRVLDGVLRAFGVDPGDPRVGSFPDAIADLLDSLSVNTPTFVRDDIDIVGLTQIVGRMSQAEVDRVFNQSTIECGATEPFVVVCPPGVLDMAPGDVYALGMVLAAPAPDGDPAQSFIYSAVFDSDGDLTNDWVFNPPFDFDLFQGADRWYQLSWDHRAGAWSLSVSQVDAAQQIAGSESAVRAVVSGTHVVFFVPASEVGRGAHRLTAFGHDGSFSESNRGADVSGVDPTEPLMVPDLEPIETAPIEPVD